MPTHGACGRTWRGTAACHCSGCCRTFSGTKLFDRHRHLRGNHGGCRDPETLPGFELWSDGVWHSPAMTDIERARVQGGARRGRST